MGAKHCKPDQVEQHDAFGWKFCVEKVDLENGARKRSTVDDDDQVAVERLLLPMQTKPSTTVKYHEPDYFSAEGGRAEKDGVIRPQLAFSTRDESTSVCTAAAVVDWINLVLLVLVFAAALNRYGRLRPLNTYTWVRQRASVPANEYKSGHEALDSVAFGGDEVADMA